MTARPPENPHDYPFQLLDRIDECEPGKHATSVKTISANEPFFQGHFHSIKVMPGVYLIEACAQTAGHVIHDKRQPAQACYLSYIETFRIRKPVTPGDTLTIHTKLERQMANLFRFICTVKRQEETIADGILILGTISHSD